MTIEALLGFFYTATLAGLSVYALHIITLMLLYLRRHRQATPLLPHIAEDALPCVCVQIPLRNEQHVAQRILNAVAKLAWPRERLEIQVLDDSNDATTAIIKEEIDRLRQEGVPITLLHRERPQGHKAGALAQGMQQSSAEFIAIFDADFCPKPDFLKRTVPHMVANPELGALQTRWGHLNREYSLATRAQAMILDAHFTIDHISRNRNGLLMNFNGTAGIWRRKTITEAGGWQSDTVAEDLDLSYRAQLAGWKILYLPGVVACAELPPLASSFKQQQYRWAKGAAQTLRKLTGPILKSPRLTVVQKLMALLHLSGYLTQPLILLLVLLTLPMALYTPRLPAITALLGVVTTIPSLFYLLGQISLYRDWPRRMLYYPVVMFLGIGITWNSTRALFDGLTHWGGEFVRTPKFKLQGKKGSWQKSTYNTNKTLMPLGEALTLLYVLVAVLVAHQTQQTNYISLSLLYLMGEGFILWGSLRQMSRSK